MLKSELTGLIQKYYLNGAVKNVRWEVVDKNAYVDFQTDDGVLIATVCANTGLEDNVFAVNGTDRLISLLSALGDEVVGQYKKQSDKTVGLTISDDKTEAYFATGDLAAVPDRKGSVAAYRERGRKLKRDLIPAYTVKLTKDAVQRFLKGRKALSDAKVVGFVKNGSNVDWVINYSQRNENKFTVQFPAVIVDETAPKTFGYNVDYLATVLTVNDSARETTATVMVDGLIHFNFKAEDYEANYYVNPLQLV